MEISVQNVVKGITYGFLEKSFEFWFVSLFSLVFTLSEDEKHPYMDFLHRFPCVQGGGRAGIYPAVSGAKLLDQSLVHHRATERRRQTTTRTHNYGQFRAAISLMCLSLLDCGRKPWGTNTRTR